VIAISSPKAPMAGRRSFMDMNWILGLVFQELYYCNWWLLLRVVVQRMVF